MRMTTRRAWQWMRLGAAWVLVSCSAQNQRVEPPPLVAGGGQTVTACASADWRVARLCPDAGCAAEALGPACATCVASLSANTCTGCLGEPLCEHSVNIAAAREVLEPAPAALAGVRFHKVGAFPIGGLEGASRRGTELVVVAAGGLLGESRRASASVPELQAVVSPMQHTVLTDTNELLWKIPGALDECIPPTVSPMGRWVATACGNRLRVYELATGLLHHDLELARPVEPAGLLGLSDLSPLYHCFGGDAWLAVPAAGGWKRVDLESGETSDVALPGDPEAGFRLDSDEVRVTLSWDGSHIAVGKTPGAAIQVGSVDGSDRRTIDLDSTINDFTFDGSRSLIVNQSGGFARIDLAGTTQERAAKEVGEQIAAGRAWWVRSVENQGANVWQPFGRNPITLNPAPRDTGREYAPPRGLAALDTVVALDDGRFVGGAPSFGVTFFDSDGHVAPGTLGRGEALWLTAIPGTREVVIGHDEGVRAWNIDTFDSHPVALPAEFAQVAPRFMHGWIIGAGTHEDAFTGLERDNRLFLIGPDDERVQLETDSPIESVAIVNGHLHVATRTGISTFDLSADTPRARAAHQFVNPLEPVKGETAQFSADGAHALVLEDGRAKLYETTDYTRSIDTFPAASCAFSSAGAAMACLAVAKDLSVRLHSYDLIHRTEIRSHSADSNAARGLSVLRVVDTTADGQQIVLGRGNEWIAVADLEAGELLGRRGKHAAFVGDEIASTDGVYLYVENLTATAPSRDRLPD